MTGTGQVEFPKAFQIFPFDTGDKVDRQRFQKILFFTRPDDVFTGRLDHACCHLGHQLVGSDRPDRIKTHIGPYRLADAPRHVRRRAKQFPCPGDIYK